MSSWTNYGKLYQLGHPSISDLFLGPVVIEEKVDGSQFSFGFINDVLKCKSKNVEMRDLDDVPDLFQDAVNTVKRLHSEGKLVPDWTYRGEAFKGRNHNTLTYDRQPTGGIVLFDIATAHEAYLGYEEKANVAARMGLELAPKIYEGTVASVAELNKLLDRVSFLGGPNIEGIVVKNHSRFGVDGKPLMGKLVSEAFKEVNNANWKGMKVTNGDVLDKLAERYATPQRWEKARQHLRDAGLLTNTPTDIGALMKEVSVDVHTECEAEIKEILFKWAWDRLHRRLTNGLPLWYKQRLLEQQSFEQPKADEETAA